jgi:hypothetical protein
MAKLFVHRGESERWATYRAGLHPGPVFLGRDIVRIAVATGPEEMTFIEFTRKEWDKAVAAGGGDKR